MKINFLERIISFFAPRIAADRLRARMVLEFASRRYEAAGGGRRFQGVSASSTSANAEIGTGITMLRNRARDLERNNPDMAAGLDVIATETIGSGIMHKYSSPRVQKKFDDWANYTKCDPGNQLNLYGLQQLAMRTAARDGEVYVRRIRTPYIDESTAPLQLQLLESDFLDVSDNRVLSNGNVVVQGIELEAKTGRRIAYHIFKSHPGESFATNAYSSIERVRIPAEDMTPVFKVLRSGQLRGISWASSVMLKMYDYADFEDAQLQRQKLAACFAAFIIDAQGVADSSTAPPIDKLEPAMIEVLGPGQDIKFGSPPGVEGFKDSALLYKRAISQGFGITYEALTNDYSNVNFSSARMGAIRMYKNVDTWRWNMFIPQFNHVVSRWFLESLELMGTSSKNVTCKFTCPRREMIDPSIEVPARIKEVRAGFKSLATAIREGGEDFEEVIDEIAESNAALDKKGIIADSDPRKVTQQGMAQMEVTSGAEPENNNQSSKK
jgi:lambda family phage portal protein